MIKKLIATTALVATTLAAGTANASDRNAERILTAIGTAIIFNEIYKDRTEQVGRVQGSWGSEHNPLNERHRPGYAAGANNPNKVCSQEVIRHGNYSEVVESNCYGQVINVRVVRR